ncbi:unnamed protein product [Heterobilharzia americana]|nr:unnamed protein product [Heterobilharzia americana]
MPDISEYRLGSACRVNSCGRVKEETISGVPNKDVRSIRRDEDISGVVNDVREEMKNDASDYGLISNSVSNVMNISCCCREDINESLALTNSSSWLRRLFTSSLFNMDLAIQYLFQSEDVGVQAYLADRLFGFPESDVDFYLLQLVSLYGKSPILAEHLTNYFIYRCTKSVSFAINLVWLLDTFSPHPHDPIRRVSSVMLSRPSSVPLFSNATSQLYSTNPSDNYQFVNNNNNNNNNNNRLTKLKTTASAITSLQKLDNSECKTDNTTIPLSSVPNSSETTPTSQQCVYSAEILRELLLPVDNSVWEGLILSSVTNKNYNTELHNDVNTHDSHSVNNTSPSTSTSKLSLKISHTGHKRTTSDVTSLRTSHHLSESRHRVIDQLNLISNNGDNNSCNKSTETTNHNPWSSSQDSAVCLSNVDVDLHVSSLSNYIPLNHVCPSFNHFSTHLGVPFDEGINSLHRTHALRQSSRKWSMSMNKIITKEILPQSHLCQSSVSLQGLNSTSSINCPPPSCVKSSSLGRTAIGATVDDHSGDNRSGTVVSSYSPDKSTKETKKSEIQSMECCISTTASSSPLDSGLYMTAPNVSSNDDVGDNCGSAGGDNNDMAQSSGSPYSSNVDRALALRSYLVPRLLPEWDFVDGLLRIAHRLVPISPKEQRTAHLQAELANLNLHLPAHVWLPVNKAGHIVLRIPPTAAVCLNSKDKAPFLIYVEILSCDDDPSTISLPNRPITSSSSKSSTRGRNDIESNSLTSFSVYPWNLNSHTSSSSEVVENNEIGANTASDELSLRSSVSNVSLGEELEFNRYRHVDGQSIGYTDDQLNGTSMVVEGHKEDSFTGTDSGQAGEIRNRLKEQCELQPHRSFRCDPEDPSAAVLKEPWHMKRERIRATSPWGTLPGWSLTSAIVKVGDDLRQEQLAYQMLTVLKNIWESEHVPLWLRPLTVVVISLDSGFIEPVPDTVSFHQIKRHARLSLVDYLHREHGADNSEAFLTAQHNFVQSCAAYCLVGYLFQVKDRHNGNILLDNEGHVIHIDYGFILSSSPGKNLGFETSPFKLTLEQVNVMGGIGSDLFEYFKLLLLRGLLAARKHMERICILVEIARATCPQLPCFARGNGNRILTDLRQRFQLSRTDEQLKQLVDQMVQNSMNSMTTKLYDSFQYYTNGIQ